jgi:hypothetical protein
MHGINERELMAAIRDDGSVQSLMRNDSARQPPRLIIRNQRSHNWVMLLINFTQNDAYTKYLKN